MDWLRKFAAITRSETAADKVLACLEAAIIEGKIPPGTKLVETKLAEKFGVSRPPVREALRRLGSSGLVKVVPYKCAVTVLPDTEKTKEIYSTKRLIETCAAREAAIRLNEKQITQLESLVRKMETYVKRQEGDKYIRVNQKFHNLINQSAGNRTAYEIYQELDKQTLWHRIHLLTSARTLKRILREHKKILDALIQRNPDLAESLMKKHLEYSESILIERLERQGKGSIRKRGGIECDSSKKEGG